MPEENETIKHAPLVTFGDNDVVVYVGKTRGAEEKYGVAFPLPGTDSEATERYNLDIDGLVAKGIRAIRPSYANAFDDDGDLVEGGQELMQQAADEYKIRVPGAPRAPRETKKSLAGKVDAATTVAIEMARDAGVSEEDVKAMIAKIATENATE